MNEMTAQNLRSAFGGESQAHMRYLVWSKVAEKEGYLNVMRLFKAIAYAEQVHATNHFKALKNEKGDFSVTSGAGFGLSNTSDNLQAAADGELFEVVQMYPAYIAVAEMQNENIAVLSMKSALEAEKTHAELYLKAKSYVDNDKDFDINNIDVCEICGFTTVEGLPDTCPICGAKKEFFKTF